MIEAIIKFLLEVLVGLVVVYVVWWIGTEIIAAMVVPAVVLTVWKVICLLIGLLVLIVAAKRAGYWPV